MHTHKDTHTQKIPNCYLEHISTLQITFSALVSFHFILIRPLLWHIKTGSLWTCGGIFHIIFFTRGRDVAAYPDRHEPRWCTGLRLPTGRWAELARRGSCSPRWEEAEREQVWLQWRVECWYLQKNNDDSISYTEKTNRQTIWFNRWSNKNTNYFLSVVSVLILF